ncbi:translation initiation factor eIF-2B subunit beta-like [Bombyx mandarina]|uniref:Translation initiation factor eIF2B subunit beta n=1 Tax=Bombyx mandarina TaxID=7092 RepID=A0A6J2K7H7_BOMMA|nr:translation initiation factor eIF-2B subunit beta-like [Bombyx mandarina]
MDVNTCVPFNIRAAVTKKVWSVSVQVVALAPLYRMLPHHLYDPQSFGSLSSPLQTMEYADCGSDSLQVLAPKFDFVPPDHITLFITNQGGSCPSYIYRLLSEIYDPKDYQI